MRFNDKELKQLAAKRATVQGTLHYMKPQGGDWSDWYQTSGYKERIFKLVHNFLFYYRVTDLEDPLGVFVLEQMEVAYESPGPAAFAFSLTSNDGKHVFTCRCQEDLNKWVAALKVASYTHWKSQYEVLQCKLAKLKGITWSSPYSMHSSQISQHNQQKLRQIQQQTQVQPENKNSSTFYQFPVLGLANNDSNDVDVISRRMSKSTFYSQSHVTATSTTSARTTTKIYDHHSTNNQHQQQIVQSRSNVPVENLIDL